jgi:hypothetical protein
MDDVRDQELSCGDLKRVIISYHLLRGAQIAWSGVNWRDLYVTLRIP